MHIAIEPPDQPEIVALIADLDTYQLTLYPAESVYALDMNSLKQPNVRFAVARDAAGTAIGCGAVVITPEYAELKRMYVQPALRGQGVARRVLGLLEAEAAAAGCPRMTLETGPYQEAALALYTRYGYQRCARYGDYPDDPYSVFMDKRIGSAARA